MNAHHGAPVAERFWCRVDTSDENGCWPWRGAIRHGGYGQFWVDGRRRSYAHRVAYELAYGPITPGMVVCHQCDNPTCVRPTHLFLGTQNENLADGRAKGRMSAPPRHAGATHPRAKLTPAIVLEARQLYEAGGISQYELAARYGVSQTTMRYALSGKNWKDVA